jgi:hypothetical protein
MKVSKRVFKLSAALLALCFAGAAASQSLTGGGTGYVPLIAAEGMDLRLTVSDAGELVSISIVECEGCQASYYLPASDVGIRVGETPITARQAIEFSGQPGTVFYDRETEMVETVMFYRQ